MAVDHPEKEEIQLCAVLDALSDPLRLSIVEQIWKSGERSCGSFTEPKAKSTRSHHFKVLREAGVIAAEQRGTGFSLTVRKDDLDDRFPGLLDSILAAAKKK